MTFASDGRDIPYTPTPEPEPVKFSATKAYVGAAITAVVAVLAGLTGLIDNDTVQLVSAIGILVLGSFGTAFGVYQAPRKAVNQ